ncbi:MAG: ABC transporter substrate binding protein, partial [Pseudolabrys sp.]
AMRRRDFITLLGGAATWPVAARAQKPEQMRRVSVLVGLDEKDAEAQRRAKAFRLGMRDLGWIEGRNVQIEIRFTESNLESINKHVAEVTRLAPDIVVANSTPVIAALRATKSTIPIVFAMVNDPVGQGFISSLAHPGANITGFYFIDFEMVGKSINLLGDVKPSLSQVALMLIRVRRPILTTSCGHLRCCSNQPRSRYKQSTFGVSPRLRRRSQDWDVIRAVV